MKLPPEDVRFLNNAGIAYRTFDDGSGMLNIELLDFTLPEGLNTAQANILMRLVATYPDSPPDMWWTIPHLTTAQGGTITNTELLETYDGRTWQRWSRHLDPGSWRPGVDSLQSYVQLLRCELTAAAV